MDTSSRTDIPAIPDYTNNDQASFLVAAAQRALQRAEETGDGDPETLLLVIEAHTLLGVAAEKLQARP